jgi:hypothetical protein
MAVRTPGTGACKLSPHRRQNLSTRPAACPQSGQYRPADSAIISLLIRSLEHNSKASRRPCASIHAGLAARVAGRRGNDVHSCLHMRPRATSLAHCRTTSVGDRPAFCLLSPLSCGFSYFTSSLMPGPWSLAIATLPLANLLLSRTSPTFSWPQAASLGSIPREAETINLS